MSGKSALDLLVAAIMEADGGPSTSEDEEAIYMAEDILDTPSGRELADLVEDAIRRRDQGRG